MRSLVDSPALRSNDWLPEGLWPELDELRTRHHELLEQWQAAISAVADLHQRFEDEDEGRVQAYVDGKQPKVTGEPERVGMLAEAKAKLEAARRQLEAFLAEAVETIQKHEDEWQAELDARGAAAAEKRQEAARLLAEADQAVGEVTRTRRWLQRSTYPSGSRHISHDALSVPLPPPPPDLAAIGRHAAPNPGDEQATAPEQTETYEQVSGQ